MAAAIPALDLKGEYALLREEIGSAVRRVLESGRYVGGPEVESLEREFAGLCGVPHAVAVSSGTDALRFALIAAGVGAGHAVVTTPFTFIGTTEAITQAGARPLFVDIDPATFTLDPRRLEAAITPHTRMVLPVHLYGQAADMVSIEAIAARRGLGVIEDACQAHGALLNGRAAGSMGVAGAFSFYPTKNLAGCGEGGMVTTSDADLAARVRRLRDHGQSEKYLHVEEGWNGRLDSLQAAILRVKLRRLPEWNDRRGALARQYRDRLTRLEARGSVRLPVERPGARHVYHQFAIRIPAGDGRAAPPPLRRDRLRQGLFEDGIETGVHYPIPLHRQPAYATMALAEGSYPESEAAAREVLSLPLHPLMTPSQVERVCAALEHRLAG